mmetsp:Transcript_45972/g.82781  ORF Transcript_45972/g.82781 Transcript_45972/m.82781 type:complete len:1206 (+) Transcript_45972:75-3692(+)
MTSPRDGLQDLELSNGYRMGEFCVILKERFWRNYLDTESNGRMAFAELCQVTKDMGRAKNVKGMWLKELDHAATDFFSKTEPGLAAMTEMDLFRDFIVSAFGSTLQVWNYLHMDTSRTGMLLPPDFEDACKTIGFQGNTGYVYQCLNTDLWKNCVARRDFDPEKHPEPQEDRAATAPGKLHSSQSLPDIRPKTSPHQPRTTKAADEILKTSLQQIKMRRAIEEKHRKANVGMKSLGELKTLLVARYGNLFSAWRQALDLDGNGRLSFGEFCLAMRDLGYTGNSKAAWHALDSDNDGFIQLDDLDPETEHMVTSYRDAATDKFGNMLASWTDMCKDGNGVIDKATFAAHCKHLNWTGNVGLLYASLKNDRTRKHMSLRDYDTPAHMAFLRGDYEMITESKVEVSTDFLERNSNSFRQRWNRAQATSQIAAREESAFNDRKKDKASNDIESLRELLLKKYGTLTSAWRFAFEESENGKVYFVQFCNAMRCLGYAGNIKKCFHDLDKDDKGHLLLEDLDAESADIIKSFRKLLLKKYGSYIKAWAALDYNKSNSLDVDELVTVCKYIGYKHDAKTLFRCLVEFPGKQSISMGDLDPAAMRAYYRGDLEAMSPQEKGAAARKKKEEEMLMARKSMMGADDLNSLKMELMRKFRTMTAGWRFGLDIECNGKLSYVDFAKACRGMGFIGNIKGCWKELDDDDSGLITFNELDPDWYDKISSFSEKLLDKYTSYESAWKKIDADKSRAISAEEFVEVCADIGYEGTKKECRQLFKQLLSPQETTMKEKDLQYGGIVTMAVNRGFRMTMKDSDLLSKDDQAKLELKRRATVAQMEKSKVLGAKDMQSLKKELVRKYGSITAAWRYGLDPAQNGKIGLVDFGKACRNVAFVGDVNACFKEMDDDDSGVITFNELDATWFERLSSFQECLLGKYKTYQSAWNAIDTDKSNTIGCEELVEVCAEIGYPGSAAEVRLLFKQIIKDQSQKFVAFEDLQFGGVLVKTVTGLKTADFDDDLLTQDEKGAALRQKRATIAAEELDKVMGANDWPSLKKEMIKKFGTLTAAWRFGLDVASNGKMGLVDFSKACRNMGFVGDIKTCFSQLDDDNSGIITFNEIDSECNKQLTAFHQQILDKFDTYKIAWQVIDENGNNELDEDEFLQICKANAIQGNPRYLFRQHLKKGMSQITFADLSGVGDIVKDTRRAALRHSSTLLPAE